MKKIVDASAGVNPLGPSRKIRSAIRKAIKTVHLPPDEAETKLRKFFRSRHGIGPEESFFANSLGELLLTIPQVLKARSVAIVGPAPPIYSRAAAAAGAVSRVVLSQRDNGFFVDEGGLRNRLDGVDLLFLENPSSISGRRIRDDHLSGIMGLARQRGIHVVLNEAFIAFTGDDRYPVDEIRKGNLTVLRTTAYFYGLQGLELAHAVSTPGTIRSLEERAFGTISSLAGEAARAAYRDRTYENQSRAFVRDELKRVQSHLCRADWVSCAETDCHVMLLRFSITHERGTDLRRVLLKAGFDVKDFGTIEGLDNSFLTLSLMKHEENLKFIRLLRSVVPPLLVRGLLAGGTEAPGK